MPLLNFEARFAEDVEDGRKRRTIRAFRKDGKDPKPGNILHLYTGLRTKKTRYLGVAVCGRVRKVNLSDHGVLIDGINEPLIYHFARADGFETWTQMLAWFRKRHGLPFNGLMIEW